MIDYGIVADRKGCFYYGKLPQPIKANLVVTVDHDYLSFLEAENIATQCSSETLTIGRDKSALYSLVPDESIRLPRRFTRSDITNGTAGERIVIKPNNGVQGFGVVLYDNDPNNARALAYFDYLEAHNITAIIEERIDIMTARSPETGEEVDWNIRAVVSNQQVLGMYVRMGEPGKPVNLTRGAAPYLLDNFIRLTDSDDVQRDIALIRAATKSMASTLPDGMFGLDIVLDKNGRVCCFEINTGYIGGLQTIAKLEETTEAQLDLGAKLVETWLENIDHKVNVAVNPYAARRIGGVSLRHTLRAYDYRDHGRIVSILEPQSLDDKPTISDDVYTYMLYITRLREAEYLTRHSKTLRAVARQNVYAQYPVMAAHMSLDFTDDHTQTHEMLSCLEELAYHLGDDDPFILQTRLRMAAQLVNLRSLRNHREGFTTTHDNPRAILYDVCSVSAQTILHTLASKNHTFPNDYRVDLATVFMAYVESDYRVACALLDEIKDTYNDQPQDIIVFSSLLLALNEGNYGAVREIYTDNDRPTLHCLTTTSIMQTLMTMPEFQLPEDRLVYIDMLSRGESPIMGVLEYVSTLRKHSNGKPDKTTELHYLNLLIKALPIETHPNDERWLAKFITRLSHDASARPSWNKAITSDTFSVALIVSHLMKNEYDEAIDLARSQFVGSIINQEVETLASRMKWMNNRGVF